MQKCTNVLDKNNECKDTTRQNLPIAKGIYKAWTFVRKFTSTQNKTQAKRAWNMISEGPCNWHKMQKLCCRNDMWKNKK